MLVGVHIEQGVNHLSSPLFQLNLRDVDDEILQDVADNAILLRTDCSFFRVEISRDQLEPKQPAVLIGVLEFHH